MKLTLSAFLTLFAISLSSQSEPVGPTSFGHLTYLGEVSSIATKVADGTFIAHKDEVKEFNPKRRDGNKVIPGKGTPIGEDPLLEASKAQYRLPSSPPIITWNTASSGAQPTDPTGAVGPNHYFNAWNSAFRIWDKQGNSLTSVASLANIWPGESLGDPIIFYDRYAERFVITQFSDSPNGFLIAVCQGEDPVNDGWYTYEYSTGNSFPDYPKFSVWSDGYYITANKNSGSAGFSEVVYALERDKMIIGDSEAQVVGFPLPGISTFGFFSPLGFNANGPELPPTGNAPIIFMQDNSWPGVGTDHLKIWNVNVDWDMPISSTIALSQSINTTPFDGVFDGGSFSNLPQPSGPDIDALQSTIMYMAQYRRFADHNSVVLNFVVDLDGGNDLAGIRWYELRQANDGDDWTIYQEGTYSQPDGLSAFCGSICMDSNGNIGLGYTVVSETTHTGLRYTGRYANDPLGQMTLSEETFDNGSQSAPSFRYGDYAQMTIDPIDDKTFWHIAEYFKLGRKNRVGAFRIAPLLAADVGVLDIVSPVSSTLSSDESVTVLLRNFGTESQSNIPVTVQLAGGGSISDVFPGPLEAGTNAEFTLSTGLDLSTEGFEYELTATTELASDEDETNDPYISLVTHLPGKDLGIIGLVSPEDGSALGESEAITVSIFNFGGAAQSDFDVSYTLNSQAPINETVTQTIANGESLEYTFGTTADLSDIAIYDFVLSTSLVGDVDESNDSYAISVEKALCQPDQSCSAGHGIQVFELETILNNSGCDPGGYGQYTALVANLAQGVTHDLTLTTGYGDQHVRAWIDFNDDFVYSSSEMVIINEVLAPGQTSGSFTETIDLELDSDLPMGEHLLRIKTNYATTVPSNPCFETDFGETEDYTVNIGAVGLTENLLGANSLVLSNLGGNRFVLTFDTDITREPLTLRIHDIQGRIVAQNWVRPIDGQYRYDLDMSYATSGAYLIRLGNETAGKVIRFVVN